MTEPTGTLVHDDVEEAVLALQAELPHVYKGNKAVIPGKEGRPGHSYNYADLGDLTDALQPFLTKHGLTFVTRPTVVPGVGFVLAYALTHAASRSSLEGMYPLPDPARVTAQQVGSAITYGRRYCLGCVTGVVPDEDEDGRAASTTTAATPADAPRTPESAHEYLQLMREARSVPALRTLMLDSQLGGFADDYVEVSDGQGGQLRITLKEAGDKLLAWLQSRSGGGQQ